MSRLRGARTLTTTAGTSSLKTATLRIASNDGDENPFEIPLRLLSLNPDAASPSSISTKPSPANNPPPARLISHVIPQG